MTSLLPRVLIVDDNPSIHADYRKILDGLRTDERFRGVEFEMFEAERPEAVANRPGFRLTYVAQGEKACEEVRAACAAGDPFAMVFLDVRMPPGMDGIQAARTMWEVDGDLQVVICTAHADYSWAEMARQLGHADRWVVLKKPFDNIEVLQLAHSLTEKWALRQQTKQHVATLEQTVSERTSALRNALEQLRNEVAERERSQDAQRQIERKMVEAQRLESLGVLAGGVAHDFNNILTGIMVSASLAKMEVLPASELHRHLQLIEENSRRAAGLCEQMLSYSGKGNVETRMLDINHLVRETLDLLHATIAKDIDCAVALAELPPVRGDSARLRQVFMNLLMNAIEALQSPPRRISVASKTVELDVQALAAMTHAREAKPGPHVMVQVGDTGLGMAATEQARMFEPFYTTKFAGRGLGLCAVLGIVRSHGGAIDVRSSPGKGTEVRLYLPLATAQPAPTVLPSLSGSVIVADDEAPVRVVAAAVLKRLGLDVAEASDGAEAVSLFNRNEGRLKGVVMDIVMPRVDGVEVVRTLRSKQPDVPVIFMTGHDAAALMARVKDMPRVALLQKPFSVEQLMRAAVETFGESR